MGLWQLELRPGGAPRLPLKANNCASSTWHMGHHLNLSPDLEGREPGGEFMRKKSKNLRVVGSCFPCRLLPQYLFRIAKVPKSRPRVQKNSPSENVQAPPQETKFDKQRLLGWGKRSAALLRGEAERPPASGLVAPSASAGVPDSWASSAPRP